MTERIKLSRAKGWRMPTSTVKVDRTTKWGNPYKVGEDGTTAECVYYYVLLLAGYLNLTTNACQERQFAARSALEKERDAGWPTLRGKDLACWCQPGKPCHADVLLAVANNQDNEFDMRAYFKGLGVHVHDRSGRPIIPIRAPAERSVS